MVKKRVHRLVGSFFLYFILHFARLFVTLQANNMKQIEVVAAIIHDNEGRIFATQRGYGDYKDGWEFPGGKMEAGETPEEALVREIREELSAEISVDEFLCTVEYDYPKFHLTMHCFWCHVRLLYPDKPRHPRQKYLLTVKGRMLYQELTK